MINQKIMAGILFDAEGILRIKRLITRLAPLVLHLRVPERLSISRWNNLLQISSTDSLQTTHIGALTSSRLLRSQ